MLGRNAILLILLLNVGMAHPVYSHGGSGGPPIDPDMSVPEAVERIRSVLEREGFEIRGVIDHQANAAGVPLELRPTTLILFSKTRTESSLIRRSQTAAIDLPLKLLVWEDEQGDTQVDFNGIGYLVDRHEIPTKDSLLSFVDRVTRQFGGEEDGLVHVTSSQSTPDTVEKLKEVLTNAGFFIPFDIDYQEEADGRRRGRGRRLRPTRLLIFGNPSVGTQLMQNQQAIGIDLPQKFLVWEDRSGDVHITYNDPLFIAKRHGIQGLDTLLGNIAGALANFASQGAEP